MAFYRKTFITIILTILVPVLVFAQNQDFLSVTGTLSNGQISIESVEQRVFESSDVEIYKSGSYEARLYGGDSLISNNFFEIIENPEIWVDVEGNEPEERFISQTSTFNVKLPLNEKINMQDSRIEIWKGSQMLLSKKLAEVPLDIITAQNYLISKQDDGLNWDSLKKYIIPGLIIMGLVVGCWLTWRKIRKNDKPSI